MGLMNVAVVDCLSARRILVQRRLERIAERLEFVKGQVFEKTLDLRIGKHRESHDDSRGRVLCVGYLPSPFP